MRKATWAILIWTALAVVWIVTGWQSVDATTAGQVGGAIGTGIILFFWFIGFIVLSIVWFMSRPKYIEFRGNLMKESEARKLSKQEKAHQ